MICDLETLQKQKISEFKNFFGRDTNSRGLPHKSWSKKNLLRLFIPFLGVLEKKEPPELIFVLLEKKEPPDLITKVLEKKDIFLEKKKLMRQLNIPICNLFHNSQYRFLQILLFYHNLFNLICIHTA